MNRIIKVGILCCLANFACSMASTVYQENDRSAYDLTSHDYNRDSNHYSSQSTTSSPSTPPIAKKQVKKKRAKKKRFMKKMIREELKKLLKEFGLLDKDVNSNKVKNDNSNKQATSPQKQAKTSK